MKVETGTVHALVGENGAGKSTVMKILYGMQRPDGGEILVNGQSVNFKNPNDAIDASIGMVHQHFMLADNFTVLENIILGAEPKHGITIDFAAARKKVADMSAAYGLDVDPDILVEELGVGQRQRVEILKVLYRGARILIFDEPTAVLTPQEIEELMKIIRNLIDEGKSIILITHKLNEIKAVADRCTVLRKGKYVGTVDVATTSKEEMAELIQAISKFRRARTQEKKAKAYIHMCEEIADVENMINHMMAKDSWNHETEDKRKYRIMGLDRIRKQTLKTFLPELNSVLKYYD